MDDLKEDIRVRKILRDITRLQLKKLKCIERGDPETFNEYTKKQIALLKQYKNE